MIQIIEKIKEKLVEMLNDKSVYCFDETADFVEKFDISSIQIVQFLVSLEEEFAIEFDIEELGDSTYKSLQQLAQAVERHIQK